MSRRHQVCQLLGKTCYPKTRLRVGWMSPRVPDTVWHPATTRHQGTDLTWCRVCCPRTDLTWCRVGCSRTNPTWCRVVSRAPAAAAVLAPADRTAPCWRRHQGWSGLLGDPSLGQDQVSKGKFILRSCLSSPYIIDLQSISGRRQVTVLSTP